MNLRQYIQLSLCVAAVDCIGVNVWQIFTGDFVVMPAVLLWIKVLLDVVFVATNLSRLRLTRSEALLSMWLLFGAVLGMAHVLYGDSEFQFSRILKDSIPALLFMMKLAICRSFCSARDLRFGGIVIATFAISVVNVS